MNQYTDKELETPEEVMDGCMDGELRTKQFNLNQDVYDRIRNKQKRFMENNVKRNILITFIGLLYVSYMIYSRM